MKNSFFHWGIELKQRGRLPGEDYTENMPDKISFLCGFRWWICLKGYPILVRGLRLDLREFQVVHILSVRYPHFCKNLQSACMFIHNSLISPLESWLQEE